MLYKQEMCSRKYNPFLQMYKELGTEFDGISDYYAKQPQK